MVFHYPHSWIYLKKSAKFNTQAFKKSLTKLHDTLFSKFKNIRLHFALTSNSSRQFLVPHTTHTRYYNCTFIQLSSSTISFVPNIVCLHSSVPGPCHHWLKNKEDPWSSSVVPSAVRSIWMLSSASKYYSVPRKLKYFHLQSPLAAVSLVQIPSSARGFNMNLISLSLTPPTHICFIEGTQILSEHYHMCPSTIHLYCKSIYLEYLLHFLIPPSHCI